jgi:hypothetical protein
MPAFSTNRDTVIAKMSEQSSSTVVCVCNNEAGRCTEGEVNYRMLLQNLNGLKEHTILICICSCLDYTFLDLREIRVSLHDTLHEWI